MNPYLDFAILSFASVFVIVDPVGLIPVFLSMTKDNTVRERIQTAGTASLLTFVILFFCSVAGEKIFGIFGITLPAFEIAGGIILLLVALDMLQARRTAVKGSKEEEAEGMSKEDIAVTPLAIPMLAGPGAITAVILLSGKTVSWGYRFLLWGNLALVALLTFAILSFAARRSEKLSVIAMKIVTRLMGLLLTAIAIQFILNGLERARFLT